MNQLAMPAMDFDAPENAKTLRDHWLGFRHRLGVFWITSVLLSLITLIVAFAWPPTYRSYATILIEQQEIPEDLVRSTITSFADQRIQVISQRVMTRANLEPLIEKYNLYPDDRADEPLEVILDRMRKRIHVKSISASVIDPRSGQPTTATIAFSVAFTYETATTAQKVANELVSLYLNENIKNRTKLANEASGFLKDEAEKMSAGIQEIETRVAAFKEKNYSLLPDMNTVNFQFLDRVERELNDVRRMINQATEQRSFLEAQREQLEANDAFLIDGQRMPSSRERLEIMQRKLSAMSATYSVEHPDIIRTKREIVALEREIADQPAPPTRPLVAEDGAGMPAVIELEKRYESLRADYSRYRERYSGQHPDVLRLERELNTMQGELAIARKSATQRTADSSGSVNENGSSTSGSSGPALLQLQAQIKNNDLEQRTLAIKRDELEDKVKEYERRLGHAPEVEREYLELERDRQNAWVKYGELKAKQMEAQLAESLESERKGERFTLIEPPQAPVRPITPNRPLVLAIGLLLAFSTAAALVLVLEALDETVRGRKELLTVFGMAPLASVPYIVTQCERDAKWRKFAIGAIAFVILAGGTMWAAHVLWMPLDVLMFVGLRRFGFTL